MDTTQASSNNSVPDAIVGMWRDAALSVLLDNEPRIGVNAAVWALANAAEWVQEETGEQLTLAAFAERLQQLGLLYVDTDLGFLNRLPGVLRAVMLPKWLEYSAWARANNAQAFVLDIQTLPVMRQRKCRIVSVSAMGAAGQFYFWWLPERQIESALIEFLQRLQIVTQAPVLVIFNASLFHHHHVRFPCAVDADIWPMLWCQNGQTQWLTHAPAAGMHCDDGTPLFRPEAANGARWRLQKQVLQAPRAFTHMTSALVLLAGAVLLLIVFGRFTRSETVSGLLLPEHGLVQLRAEQSGIVQNLHVRPGDIVAKGQDLLQIRPGFTAASGSPEQQSLLNLKAQQNELDAAIDREQMLVTADRIALEHKLEKTRTQRKQVQQAIRLQTEKLALVRKRRQQVQPLLEKNLLPRTKVDEWREQSLAVELELSEQQQRDYSLGSDYQQLQDDLRNEPLKAENRLARLRREKSELDLRLHNAERAQAAWLQAPIAGRITAVRVQEHHTVTIGTELLTLVPLDSPMQAELHVPVKAAGLLVLKQAVVLRMDAFPHERFGVISAEIVGIDTTPSVLNAQQSAVYRVRAKLTQDYLLAFGEKRALLPGYSFNAEIRGETVALWQWALEPLFALRGWSS